MHGLLSVTVKRRILSAAAAVAIPGAIVTAGLAAAPPQASAAAGTPASAASSAASSSGHVSVTITAMTPQTAGPGATVSLSGTVTNGTRQTQAGLDLRLLSSAARFTARDTMNSFVSHGTGVSLEPVGQPFFLATSLAPGQSASWHTSFEVSAVGMSEFGVYPVAAQLQDISGDVLQNAETLLPYWPGQRSAGLSRPLSVSWVWPLIDQPHRLVCGTLTSNGLAPSLSPGGRLSTLLNAGSSHPEADLTWFVDPALLADVSTMTQAYRVGGAANCTGGVSQKALPSAASWLSGLKLATAGQPTVITPYANVDSTALFHQNMTTDLAAAYRLGAQVASGVLGGQPDQSVAWPSGGTADLSVLTKLSTAEKVSTVVLSSSELPAAQASVFSPDDAVSSIRTEAGTPMTVLLADSTLTGLLRTGNTTSGTLPASTEFDVRQRFLAETAMIAAEAPDSARTLVVAPPQSWSPSQTLADDLLSETTGAPWLKPTRLSSLSSAPDTERQLPRKSLPATKASPGELGRAYLTQVGALSRQVGLYKAMLDKASPGYVQSLSEALAATESAAWRGSRAAQGQLMRANLAQYMSIALKKVGIISSPTVTMGGSSGLVPMTIQNGLTRNTIRVRVVVSVDNTLHRSSPLTIGRFQDVVVIPPGDAQIVRLPVKSAPQGSTQLHISLTTPQGVPLPIKQGTITVQSTRYGRAILFLIGAAIGVLLLTSGYRAVRRWLRDDSRVVSEKAGPAGSVVDGTTAQDPTEAPDDLADARRWVDDA